MADDLTKEQRHKNMKNIHGKDTKIEVILRKALWNKGYRYRKNYKKLPGSPDIVLTKYKIAIFCDGEFFHGKDWDTLKQRLEKSNNSEYWISKISRNKEREFTELSSFDSFFFSSGIIKLAIRHKMPATSNIISTVVIILSAFTNSKLLYQKIHLHPVLQ